MRRRRPSEPDEENLDRWMVSYADFITLLLAFFVVMYAISSVNEGKYRILSGAMLHAFGGELPASEPGTELADLPRLALEPVVPSAAAVNDLTLSAFAWTERMDARLRQSAADTGDLPEIERKMDGMAKRLQASLAGLIEQDLVSIRRDALWIEIDIRTSVLFPSASAQPGQEARPVLRKIARELRDMPGRIHVEGFTDNLPINTAVYPSNWELSSGRAASVVRLLSEEGVDPRRMAAIGYGAHRPVASNDTVLGRQQNRRVVLVLLVDYQPDARAGRHAMRVDVSGSTSESSDGAM